MTENKIKPTAIIVSLLIIFGSMMALFSISIVSAGERGVRLTFGTSAVEGLTTLKGIPICLSKSARRGEEEARIIMSHDPIGLPGKSFVW